MEKKIKEDRMNSNLEDYLEAIALLFEEHGQTHAGDGARRLNLRMSSVTNALRLLTGRGCLDDPPVFRFG